MTKFWVYISKLTIRQLERLLTGPDVFYMRTSFSDIIPVNIGNSGCPNFSMPLNSSTNPSPLNSCEITQLSNSCLGATLLSLFPPASESRGNSTLRIPPSISDLFTSASFLNLACFAPHLGFLQNCPTSSIFLSAPRCKTRTPFRLGFRLSRQFRMICRLHDI